MLRSLVLRRTAVLAVLSTFLASSLSAQENKSQAPAPKNRIEPTEGQRRKVVLKLNAPAGEPAPAGELNVTIFPKSGVGNASKTFPVTNGRVEFDAPAPCRLYWQTDKLVGCWIKEESIELAEAPEPLVKEIPAHPAGVISGRALDEDGSPCRRFTYSLVMLSRPPDIEQSYLGIPTVGVVAHSSGQFTVGPLPLGGMYRVDVQGHGERANARAASEEITLTREERAPRVELRLPNGITVSGKVVDPQGNPVAGVEVRLGHRSANRSYEGAATPTDSSGAFRFPHVNPEFDGAYYLHIQPQKQFRGRQVRFRPGDEPLTVRLQPGWSVEGVLLEHSTGKIVPGATIYARPAQYDQSFYLGSHEAQTDDAGRFRFETLEPLLYRFYTNGVNAAQGAPPWEADPRSNDQIILSGDLHQGADLTPVPPPPDP